MAVLSLSAVRDAYTIRASFMRSLTCTGIGLADVCCCYWYPSARGQEAMHTTLLRLISVGEIQIQFNE